MLTLIIVYSSYFCLRDKHIGAAGSFRKPYLRELVKTLPAGAL